MERSQQERQAVTTLLRAGQFAELDRRHEAFQLQYEQAKINDRDLTLEYQAFYDTAPENEQYLSHWIASNPKSYPALLARGIYYRTVAGEKRGDASARDTPRENVIQLSKYLGLANHRRDGMSTGRLVLKKPRRCRLLEPATQSAFDMRMTKLCPEMPPGVEPELGIL